MKKQRGLSEILGTIIVLVITIFAGIFVYEFFFGAASRLIAGPGIQVESAQIVQSGSNYYLVTTIHNTGGMQINYVNITIPGTQFSAKLGGMAPGGTEAGTFLVRGYNPGTTYTIVYTAVASNNQTYTTTYPIS